MSSFLDVVKLLAGGGGLGAIIAFVFERLGWFQGLSPKGKFWLVLAMCLILPIMAQSALIFIPSSVWQFLEQYWPGVLAGFVAWISSQYSHAKDKTANKSPAAQGTRAGGEAK